MTINISSVHFKADQKLEDFINEKVEKLNKVHDGIIGSDVILKLENTDAPENKTVEIRMKIKGNDAIATKTAKTFEEATDVAVGTEEAIIKKQRERAGQKIRFRSISYEKRS